MRKIGLIFVTILIHQTISEYCYCRDGKEGEDDYLECEFFGRDQAIEGISLIHLKHNTTIPVLKKGLIQPFKSLKTLYITSSNVERIEPGALNSHNLEILDLYHNKLKTIENGTFNSLRTLKTLDVSYNRLETLDSDTFTGLTSLEWLSLISNRIRTVNKATFTRLTKLKALHLAYNKIDTLEFDTFKHLAQLQLLDISFNSLKTVRSGLFANLRDLRTLSLQHNYLKEIRDDLLETNSGLVTLDFSQNQIGELRENLFRSLEKLEVLKFYSNSVSKLNATILLGNVPELKEVHLYYNQWECEVLKEMLGEFEGHFVFVATAAPVLASEIYGIGCNQKKD